MRRSLTLALLLLAALAPPALAAGPGRVEGTVTPVGAAEEVEVCAVEAKPSESCAVPDASGSYALTELELGPQRIEFLPSFRSRLLTQYFDHKDHLAEARTISLTSKDPIATGIDADLIEGGAIRGKVTALDGGADLAGVEVCAKSTTTPPVRSCDETDASGEYELHSLLGGTYKVGFWGRGASAEYQPQYYAAATTLAQATPVTVGNGAITTGIDVALARGAEIGGTVRAALGGAALGDISVCLFATSGSGPERCTYSGEDGTYRFQGLASGSYQVGFSLSLAEIGGEGAAGEGDGFETQFFAQVPSRAEAQALALSAPQAVSNVDASLLAPPPPPPPAPPPPVAVPLVAAPAAIAVPPTKKGCKRGYRKQQVKGKARCVRPHGRKKHRRHRKHSRKRRHKGGGK